MPKKATKPKVSSGKKKKKNDGAKEEKKCFNCPNTEPYQWYTHKGKYMCNACHTYAKRNRGQLRHPDPEVRKGQRIAKRLQTLMERSAGVPSGQQMNDGMEEENKCSNCNLPMIHERRLHKGKLVCNICYGYARRNGGQLRDPDSEERKRQRAAKFRETMARKRLEREQLENKKKAEAEKRVSLSRRTVPDSDSDSDEPLEEAVKKAKVVTGSDSEELEDDSERADSDSDHELENSAPSKGAEEAGDKVDDPIFEVDGPPAVQEAVDIVDREEEAHEDQEPPSDQEAAEQQVPEEDDSDVIFIKDVAGPSLNRGQDSEMDKEAENQNVEEKAHEDQEPLADQEPANQQVPEEDDSDVIFLEKVAAPSSIPAIERDREFLMVRLNRLSSEQARWLARLLGH